MEYHNLLQQDPSHPSLPILQKNLDWYLMCPDHSPGLSNVYGAEFEELYNKYILDNKYVRKINILELWEQILHAQSETGTPYMLYKDSCNSKSNQKNLGTIQSSNLCSEIIEYTDSKNISVCNLASIALPRFIINGSFDFQKLYDVTRLVTRNLNEVIDINFYPVPETEYSNINHRPIGIGVQGLADTFIRLRYPFESPEAFQLNTLIFETMYFAFLSESNELAKQFGAYNTYKNSPMDHGILQPDMWNYTTSNVLWNWDELRKNIKTYGVRNSLGIALMPTASTSQILGNFEAFEPIKYNIYTRRTLSGNFYVINKYLINDLLSLKLWNSDMKNTILANDGSIQNISEIPKHIRDLYKTAWEIKQRSIIDLAAGRGPFVDQSQSMNLVVAKPSFNLLTSIHLHAWESGLKTGLYYLRSIPNSDAIKFTVDPKFTKQNSEPKFILPELQKETPLDPIGVCT
jgi:ribonucleoside-diphosphate reductase alpha chain